MQVNTGTQFESRLKHPDGGIQYKKRKLKGGGVGGDFNLFQNKCRVIRHFFFVDLVYTRKRCKMLILARKNIFL